MTSAKKAENSSLFQRLLDPVSGTAALKLEKARLEAFLAAVPGEYCGFSKDGSVIFSPSFAGMLGLTKIETITDIQNVLSTSDAAALEGQYYDLHKNGKPFAIIVKPEEGKQVFRLSGSRGQALENDDAFEILWLEDVTNFEQEKKQIEQKRDEAQIETKRLQTAMDCLPQMIWIRDGYTALIWCNQTYADALGISPAEVIADQKEIAVTKSKGLKPKELAREALAHGSAQETKVHAIMNGKRKYIHMTETPLPGTGQTLGIARDISREEELERDIKRYAQAHQELMEQLRTAIGMFGPDQKLEFYNSAYAQLWGLEDQWLNTKPKLGEVLEKLRELRRLPEQSDFRTYKESWVRMFTLLEPHEDMMYLPDGTALRLLVIPNPSGGMMTTFEDVTSRLELESSYNTLIAVQKETLDNLAEGVVVFGGDGRAKLWNPSFRKLWNLNNEDLDKEPHINELSEKLAKHFPAETRAQQQKFLTSLALERKEKDDKITLERGNVIEYATVPLPDGGVLVSFYDITDTVNVENALREKNLALETAEKLKLDFLANVSYQLRTPLNAMMGFNEILDNEYFGVLTGKQKEYTTGIQEAGERLMNLINDILDLSTLEAGYLELDYDEFNIAAMLDGIYDLTTDWARVNKLNVTIACDPALKTMEADQSRMKQVFVNLIRNAIHFTPEGGTITVTAKPKDAAHIEFTVNDTGIGIPKDQQKKVFEPFERLESSKEQTRKGERGAGLGLSLVRNIIELHGGKVEIDSTEGKGTTVTLTMPVKQP